MKRQSLQPVTVSGALALLATFCLLVITRPSQANTPASPIQSIISAEEEAVFFSNEGNIAAIATAWAEIREAVEANHLNVASDKMDELNRLRKLGGFESLDDYSQYLIQQGLDRLQNKDPDTAAFLARSALELSPTSPEILLRSLWIVRATGMSTGLSQIKAAVKHSWRSPAILLRGIEVAVYPALWAATIACYLVLVLFACYRIQQYLRMFSRMTPGVVRGIAGPFLCIVALILPCFAGPLWSILLWSALSVVVINRRTWVPLITGVLLMLWGSAIPLKESLSSWLADPRAQALLASNSGDFKFAENRKELLLSFAGERRSDGVPYFVLGQELKRRREHAAADRAFERAEVLLGTQPWTAAQRGLAAFGAGDYAKADTFFADAQAGGLNSAEFLFNYSRIKFELLDVAASREYFTRASRKDPARVSEFESLSDQPALSGIQTLAEIRLPAHLLIQSAIAGQPGMQTVYDTRAAAVMPGLTPVGMQVAGVMMILLLMVPYQRGKRARRAQAYFIDYFPPRTFINIVRLIPGGAWVVAGKPVSATIIMAALVVSCFPMMGWPAASIVSIDGLAPFLPYYPWVVMLLALGIIFAGYYLKEDA